MKNGFLNKNNNKILPFNSSKNIEHKGLRLFDYIENLKKNIINLFNTAYTSLVGIGFNTYIIQSNHYYENLNYNNTWYNRYTCNKDYEITTDGIVIKSATRVSMMIVSEVRNLSNITEAKYLKVQVYRNGSLLNEEFTSVTISSGGNGILTLPYFYYANEGDIIKIQAYGSVNDSFYATRVNMELTQKNETNHYDF